MELRMTEQSSATHGHFASLVRNGRIRAPEQAEQAERPGGYGPGSRTIEARPVSASGSGMNPPRPTRPTSE